MPDGKPKIQIMVNFGRPRNESFWYIDWQFGIKIAIAYFATVWYTSSSFCIIFPHFGILYQENSGNPGANSYINMSTSYSLTTKKYLSAHIHDPILRLFKFIATTPAL
jgi:hypothetical protein